MQPEAIAIGSAMESNSHGGLDKAAFRRPCSVTRDQDNAMTTVRVASPETGRDSV